MDKDNFGMNVENRKALLQILKIPNNVFFNLMIDYFITLRSLIQMNMPLALIFALVVVIIMYYRRRRD